MNSAASTRFRVTNRPRGASRLHGKLLKLGIDFRCRRLADMVQPFHSCDRPEGAPPPRERYSGGRERLMARRARSGWKIDSPKCIFAGMATIVQCNCGAEYRRTEEKFLVPHTGDAICAVCGGALLVLLSPRSLSERFGAGARPVLPILRHADAR